MKRTLDVGDEERADLRALIAIHRIHQRRLAEELLGISDALLGDMLNGSRTMSPAMAGRIRRAIAATPSRGGARSAARAAAP